MNRVFIKRIHIEKVRHLRDVDIVASEDPDQPKHIIFTGKNGSGKTSLLDAIAGYLKAIASGKGPAYYGKFVSQDESNLRSLRSRLGSAGDIRDTEKRLEGWRQQLAAARNGLDLTFNIPEDEVYSLFDSGRCIFAYFKARRAFDAEQPKHIEKVEFKERYAIDESPRSQFVKYLLDLKMTQALAASNGKAEKAQEIQRWFDGLQGILRDIYEDDSLTIEFDEETYRFSIIEQGREPFDFNETSDGFSAVLDIIVDLMLRMTKERARSLDFDLPGIVLIDEVENHLHLSLQKKVLPFLAGLFPNIQFVVSTHSPFVLSSIPDAVAYDLEHGITVPGGLSDNTYESIVEGYFGVDSLSAELREKYDRYLEIVAKERLDDSDLAEAADLEVYLDEIPDYLALDITTEYKRKKLELRSKVVAG